VAVAVQTLWLLLLDRNTHETVVCYGAMQILIAIVKKSGVMDAVKDLAAQALYMMWSEEVIDIESKKCPFLYARREVSVNLPKEYTTAISLQLDKLSVLYRKITAKVLTHSAACASPDMYTLQPALLNVFWLVNHLGEDVIQASCHEFGLQMIGIIWMQNDTLLTGIGLDILSLLLKKGMVATSPSANLLLSLLPILAQGGDAKIQEKIQYCAQFAPDKEIDRLRKELQKERDENLSKEKILHEQSEVMGELRRQLAEREVILNDFMQNHRLAEDLRKLEEANYSGSEEKEALENQKAEKEKMAKNMQQLEDQLQGMRTKFKEAKKRNKESNQKARKAEERVRQLEKTYETASRECKDMQEVILKMEQAEKNLQAQLLQSKLIQLQQQKKLQQVCSPVIVEDVFFSFSFLPPHLPLLLAHFPPRLSSLPRPNLPPAINSFLFHPHRCAKKRREPELARNSKIQR
jgi:hypothetical protein